MLNHLFGNNSRENKDTARKLVMDENKRMTLWNEHLSTHLLREKLCENFNFKNVDSALQNFEATKDILIQLENLISPEFVNINNEEKNEVEILDDLKKLKTNSELDKLCDDVVYLKQKQSNIIALFDEMLLVLRTELHLIQLLKTNPINSRDLLLKLFEIIFHKEARLYQVFMEKTFRREENKHIHFAIVKIARSIILEEELKEEIESDEEKFVREIVTKMGLSESRNSYRLMAENMYLDLADMAGAPLRNDEDILDGINRLGEFIKDDVVMYNLVKKLKPKYTDLEIKMVILAFRFAFDLGHFDDYNSEFAT